MYGAPFAGFTKPASGAGSSLTFVNGYPVLTGATRLFTLDASKNSTFTFSDGTNHLVNTATDANGGSVTLTLPNLNDRHFQVVANTFGTRPGLVPNLASGPSGFNGQYNTTGSLTAASNAGAALWVFQQITDGFRPIILGSGMSSNPQIFLYTNPSGVMNFTSVQGSGSNTIAEGTPGVIMLRWNGTAMTLFSDRFAKTVFTYPTPTTPIVVLDQITLTAGTNPGMMYGLMDVFSGTPADSDCQAVVSYYATAWGV